MATRSLLEMLDAAIGTPRVGVVDSVALHELLKAMIIGQPDQKELSVLEPGQSPTLGLGKGKVTKEKPGQEEKQRDICKKRASLQDLWEEINKFKEAQCGLAEDMREMKEAMQEAHSGMEQDMQEMKEAMQKAHSALAEDMRAMQKAHSGVAEDMRAMQKAHSGVAEDMRAMQKAHSGLAEDMRAMQKAHSGVAVDMRAMQKAHSGLAEDMRVMQKAHSGMAEDMRAMQKAHSGVAEDMRAMQKAHSGLAEDMRAMQKAHSGVAEDMRAMQKAHSGVAVDMRAMQKAHSGLVEDMRAMQKAHSGMAEDMREMQEAMQKAHSGMAQDIQEMKDAHSGLAEDIQEIQETLGLEGGGGQSAPSEPTQVAMDSQARKSSALGPKGSGTRPGMETSKGTTGSGSQGMQAGTQGVQPASSSSQATIPGDAQEPAKPWGSTSTSSYESEMREVLSQVGQLGHLCTGLKEEVEQLKSAKAERADLEDVRRLFPKGGRQSITSILSYLKCQMSFLQDMARTLHGEEEKISKVEDAPRKTRGAGAGRKADGSGQMTRQPRPKGQMDEPRATVQSGGHELAGCQVCSPDTRVLLGKQLQRCEKLEEQVESLTQKAGSKVDNYPKWRRQQDEQLKCLQASIVQLQKDYEKLSSAHANLQQDRQQEQNDIKALSQALERLKSQKADKEELLVLGIDEKADKAALADKVSRSQFEACVERLNKVMEEVTSRVTGQEKGWHQFQKELQKQMDCKLDRRELGAFRKQQEERWKSLRGQLQEKALQAERDDAAGIRKERTGECRYPTVPRSCGGPHTVTPPRFQPQPPSTPRPSQPSARSPNKKDAMQLSGQDGTDGNRQDEQLSMTGASQLPTTPTATPETSTSSSRPSTPSPLLSAMLKRQPVSSPGLLILPPKLRLPPIQRPRSEPTP